MSNPETEEYDANPFLFIAASVIFQRKCNSWYRTSP